MQPDIPDEEAVKGYLLGAELASDAQDRIEERLIAEDDYFERVRAIEDELIDSYLDGSLTSEEGSLFQQHFLKSSRRQNKVRLFRFWRRASVRRQNSERRLLGSPTEVISWWGSMVSAMSKHRTLAVASGLAIFLVIVGFWVARWRSGIVALQKSNQHLSSQLDEEQGLRAKLEQQVSALSRSHGRMVASFVLALPSTRGGGGLKSGSTIAVPLGVQVLRLELPVPYEADAIYSVVIETVEGEERFRQDDLAARPAVSKGIVDVVLPADLLDQNDYIVTLRRMQVQRGRKELNATAGIVVDPGAD